jgi:hypothetical protein
MMLPTASKERQHNLSNLRVGSNGTVNRLKALHLTANPVQHRYSQRALSWQALPRKAQ